MNKVLKMIVIIIVAFVALLVGSIAFTWRSDVSGDARFAPYLHRKISIKDTSILIWYGDKHQYRFKPYTFEYRSSTIYNGPDMKTVKTYAPGDGIEFFEARCYYSIFVGSTYYFIGKDQLPDGKQVEFEYRHTDFSPMLWETVEEFRARREQK